MSRCKFVSFLSVVSVLTASGSMISANTLTPGDILISDSTSHNVVEYTLAGQLVQTIPIPNPGGYDITEKNRGIIVDSSGRIQVYNGTATPYLSTYTPSTNSWTQRTFPEWSSISGVTSGNLAAYQNYVYATDEPTGGGAAKGIVRFDFSNNTTQRFAANDNPADLSMSANGLLYTLDDAGGSSGRSVNVYNPVSMQLVQTVPISQSIQSAAFYDVRTLTVAANGHIFLAGLQGPIFQLDENGKVLAQSKYPGIDYTSDLDISSTGQLLITETDGTRILTDPGFSYFTTLAPSGSILDAFGTFVPTTSVPEPSALVLLGVGTAGMFGWGWKRRKITAHRCRCMA